jgi:hypothetical protein
MQTTLNTLFPYITTAVSWLIIVLGVITLTFIMAFFAYHWYNKMLRTVSWKGWYYSACLLISDMARGKAKWHAAHISKVASFLMGLRDENPQMFFGLMDMLDQLRKSKSNVVSVGPASSGPQGKHAGRN